MKKLVVLLCTLLALGSSAQALEVSAPSALLMEKETGTVRFAKDEHAKLEPASVTKVMTLLLVLVAVRLDLTMGTSYLRDGVCIAFSCNELLSIVENAGLLGVPMPELLRQAIDILQRRGKE